MGLIQMHRSITQLYHCLPEVFTAPDTPAKPGMIKKLQGMFMASSTCLSTGICTASSSGIPLRWAL